MNLTSSRQFRKGNVKVIQAIYDHTPKVGHVSAMIYQNFRV